MSLPLNRTRSFRSPLPTFLNAFPHADLNPHWLRLEFGIDKPSQKLQDVAHLDADGLAAEVKKARGRKKPLSVAEVKRLKGEHAGSVVPLQTLAGEAAALEARVSDLVNAAYGLTPEEVALMWATAPPRMPLAAPPGEKEEKREWQNGDITVCFEDGKGTHLNCQIAPHAAGWHALSPRRACSCGLQHARHPQMIGRRESEV